MWGCGRGDLNARLLLSASASMAAAREWKTETKRKGEGSAASRLWPHCVFSRAVRWHALWPAYAHLAVVGSMTVLCLCTAK